MASVTAKLRIATRRSPLALWQARYVSSLLCTAHPGLQIELVAVSTAGDRASEVPVWEMGGRGVFVGEVQAAVLSGRADAAVHSAKDLQPREPAGLVLCAFPERSDPRDALVGASLGELGPGSTVATGSQRRRAQLAALVPGLHFTSLRGNIATRLERVPPSGAVVVALAALSRLCLKPAPMEILDTEVMLPQVGQGAIAVECRSDDEATMALIRVADHPATRAAVEAERAFLAALGGGCTLPVAAHATVVSSTGSSFASPAAGVGAATPAPAPAPGVATAPPAPAPAPGVATAPPAPAAAPRVATAPPATAPGASFPAGVRLHLEALVADPAGGTIVRRRAAGPVDEPLALGLDVAQAVLAGGGGELLASLGVLL